MLGFRSEATRFENFFKKIFGLVTRFGVIVFLQKNTRFFYLTFFSFSKSIWFRLVGFFFTTNQKMAIRVKKPMRGAIQISNQENGYFPASPTRDCVWIVIPKKIILSWWRCFA